MMNLKSVMCAFAFLAINLTSPALMAAEATSDSSAYAIDEERMRLRESLVAQVNALKDFDLETESPVEYARRLYIYQRDLAQYQEPLLVAIATAEQLRNAGTNTSDDRMVMAALDMLAYLEGARNWLPILTVDLSRYRQHDLQLLVDMILIICPKIAGLRVIAGRERQLLCLHNYPDFASFHIPEDLATQQRQLARRRTWCESLCEQLRILLHNQ